MANGQRQVTHGKQKFTSRTWTQFASSALTEQWFEWLEPTKSLLWKLDLDIDCEDISQRTLATAKHCDQTTDLQQPSATQSKND